VRILRDRTRGQHIRRAVSPETALRLLRLFGNAPGFWLNAQRVIDLWEAARTARRELERISPLKAASSSDYSPAKDVQPQPARHNTKAISMAECTLCTNPEIFPGLRIRNPFVA